MGKPSVIVFCLVVLVPILSDVIENSALASQCMKTETVLTQGRTYLTENYSYLKMKKRAVRNALGNALDKVNGRILSSSNGTFNDRPIPRDQVKSFKVTNERVFSDGGVKSIEIEVLVEVCRKD